MTATVTPIKKRRTYRDAQLADQLADALTHLPDNFLACRDMRHAWEVTEDYYVELDKAKTRGKGDIRRFLTCLRCGMGRVERYTQTRWGLEKTGQTYLAPEGYKITGLPRGNKPSSVIQGEQYRRAMNRVAKSQRRSRG